MTKTVPSFKNDPRVSKELWYITGDELIQLYRAMAAIDGIERQVKTLRDDAAKLIDIADRAGVSLKIPELKETLDL